MWSLVLSAMGLAVLVLVGVGFVSSTVHRRVRAVGDADVTAELDRLCSRRTRRLGTAVIDLGEQPSTRFGFVRADATTRFEVGSVTKALTGLLLADAVDRGEVTLDTQIGELVLNAGGTELGEVTLRELCTHTSGLPRLALTLGAASRLLLFGLLGVDPYRGTSARRLIVVASRQRLSNRGQFRYSNLGGAVLGQVLARAAGRDFGDLLHQRVFDPLGMDGAGISTPGDSALWGWSPWGLPRMPWIMGGYAPAGGGYTTLPDLAVLAQHLLEERGPGRSALEPLRDLSDTRQIGMFWMIDTAPGTERAMVWHNGATGGYSAFLALFPRARRAVAVVANTARPRDTERVAIGLATWLAPGAARPCEPDGGSA